MVTYCVKVAMCVINMKFPRGVLIYKSFSILMKSKAYDPSNAHVIYLTFALL
jgi:hypothetical protein